MNQDGAGRGRDCEIALKASVADAKPMGPGVPPRTGRPAGPKLTALLRPYAPFVTAIAGFTIVANGLNLVVPKLIARAIDAFAAGRWSCGRSSIEFVAVAAGIFVFTYLQNIAQTFAAERVARDLRHAARRPSSRRRTSPTSSR